MGLISSTSYLAVFTSGTVLGASLVYLLTRFRVTTKEKPNASLNRLQNLGLANKLKLDLETIPLEERYDFPELKDEYRLVMAIRNDLKMQKGKVAAQCGHASVAAFRKVLESDVKLLQKWLRFGGTKITVKVDSEEELLLLETNACKAGILTAVVRDAGQTQVAPGSRTVIAIGPAKKSQLEPITGYLKLY